MADEEKDVQKEEMPENSDVAHEAEQAPAELAGKMHWYVVHTYSGYENKVKANLEKTIENRHLEDQILEVRVPLQDVVELKNGARKTVQRKMFPGYVLVNMDMNDETWYVVRNTRELPDLSDREASRYRFLMRKSNRSESEQAAVVYPLTLVSAMKLLLLQVSGRIPQVLYRGWTSANRQLPLM